jgi:hypothetical protein
MNGDQMGNVGVEFFGPKFRIGLSNKTRRNELEEALKKRPVSDGTKVKADLEMARKEVWERCVGYHDEWVAFLLKTKVIEDRSGETLFNGWLA